MLRGCRAGRAILRGPFPARYLALKLLGYPRVRNYYASMIEWGNRPELPVEK